MNRSKSSCRRQNQAYRRVLSKEIAKLCTSDFRGLDPRTGTGHVTLDLTKAVPQFLLSEMNSFPWPQNGIWAFDGDPDVPHYVDFDKSGRELALIVGADRVEQMRDFSVAVCNCVKENLPGEEQQRLAQSGKQLVLDLAELRISNGEQTVGSDVHVDLYPREGMVLVIPLHGSRTKVFGTNTMSGRWSGVGDLITAFDRWATFHSFDPDMGDVVHIRTGTAYKTVPSGLMKYLESEARIVPQDLLVDYPGVLPTVHKAGEGVRTVLLLNFAYA